NDDMNTIVSQPQSRFRSAFRLKIARILLVLVALARIAPVGAQVYEKVFSFTEARTKDPENGYNRGSSPEAGLVEGSDGDFYGTTSGGGASLCGTVFKMTPAGMLTTLVEFTGNGASNKGSRPSAGLVLGSDGNFYGTTLQGGAGDLGTTFRMTPT